MIANYADHSANERTFLAWVRTAISIVGFGLATARLSGEKAALWSELAMLIAGAAVILLAWLRMRHVRARISDEHRFDYNASPTDAFLLLMIAALFALLATFAIHVG
jgi:putative membrane protein